MSTTYQAIRGPRAQDGSGGERWRFENLRRPAGGGIILVMRLTLFVPLLLGTSSAAWASQERSTQGGGTTPCYASTRDWRAWIDATAGQEGPALIVTGIITTPTGGHRSLLKLGPKLPGPPPQQIVDLEIRAQGDIVTTMVVIEEVKARFPAVPHHGEVVIQCNGQEVGRVSSVKTSDRQTERPGPPLRSPPPASHLQPSHPPLPYPQETSGGEPPPPDALGDVWEEDEENSWRGTWIRREGSPLFDAYWVHPSGERVWAVVEVKHLGREVEVVRRHADGQGCSYRGTIAEDWVNVHGWYNCSWHRHSSPWRAQIVRMRDVAPAILSNGGWRRIP